MTIELNQAAKGGIPAVKYIDVTQADGATVGGSLWLGPDNVKVISFQNKWTSTYAATITIEVSNDPRANINHRDHANAEWTDITSDVEPTDPVGSAAEEMVYISNVGSEYIRMSLSSVSGTGTFVSYFRGVGG
ncbi:MAG: hypothetical protein ACYTBJ_16370 [Planctomycetota bacterium]|jgi:hypothetical protein